jgi:hypothetical protein
MTHNLSRIGQAAYVLALLLSGTALIAWAQSGSGPVLLDPTQIGSRYPDKKTGMDSREITEDMRRMHLLNVSRQKSMVTDADKLLALARALNAGVGADGNALPAAQKMRMAADIEKLAHNVKDKMSFVIGTPTSASPVRPFSDSWPQ